MSDEPASPREDLEIRLLLEAVFHRFHYDFRSYSMASLRRRLRQARVAFGVETITRLQERIVHDEASFAELLQYLTVQVSDMFRDPTFFRTLRESIVPVLKTYPSLKLWVAGCSSGEEVYSLAILLQEEGLLERTILYATDINPEALRKAEAGVYALERIAAFTENHRLSGARCSLSAYYTAAYGSAIFDRALVKRVVFSDHSLATDHVFSEAHLVTCRNVLIYFDRELQNRALGLFKDTLCRRGFLGLGSRETLQFSAHATAFRELSTEDRWYQKW